MSKSYVSVDLRKKVVDRAGGRCEYCLVPKELLSDALHIDHVIPERQGGLTSLENLALACARCNFIKGTSIAAYLPEQELIVNLYNPRQHRWQDHFALMDSGRLNPRSKIAEGSILLLQLNNPFRVRSRRALLVGGAKLRPD